MTLKKQNCQTLIMIKLDDDFHFTTSLTFFQPLTFTYFITKETLLYERCEIIVDDRKFISLSLKEYIIVVVNFDHHQNIK